MVRLSRAAQNPHANLSIYFMSSKFFAKKGTLLSELEPVSVSEAGYGVGDGGAGDASAGQDVEWEI